MHSPQTLHPESVSAGWPRIEPHRQKWGRRRKGTAAARQHQCCGCPVVTTPSCQHHWRGKNQQKRRNERAEMWPCTCTDFGQWRNHGEDCSNMRISSRHFSRSPHPPHLALTDERQRLLPQSSSGGRRPWIFSEADSASFPTRSLGRAGGIGESRLRSLVTAWFARLRRSKSLEAPHAPRRIKAGGTCVMY